MYEMQLNILLADDDIDDCIFFKGALEKFHISTTLTSVHDGEQLMKRLEEETELPHVLFLDLNMPRKNGFECLAEIKAINRLKHLPVIMYSTSYEQEMVNLLHKNGAQHFIRKPSEFSLFKELIQQTLTGLVEGMSKPNLSDTEGIDSRADRENFVLTVRSGILSNNNPITS